MTLYKFPKIAPLLPSRYVCVTRMHSMGLLMSGNHGLQIPAVTVEAGPHDV
eukprot:SAG31_NODE_32635_length_353_cov_0.838583_2_plen_50_part_01